jgi:hypothetical protein
MARSNDAGGFTSMFAVPGTKMVCACANTASPNGIRSSNIGVWTLRLTPQALTR